MSYFDHLSKDKKLKDLLQEHGQIDLKKSENIFLSLCSSIMSQQLSTRVAEVIYGRFLMLFDGRDPSPDDILLLKHQQLRSIGLSNSKVTYMQNVAKFAIEKGMDHNTLDKMDAEQIISYLIEIKGVGRWTIEMILMFALGREDIFAADDLGIQNAMETIYKLDKSDKENFRKKILVISNKWSPYRTYACMHLWRWKDKIKRKEGVKKDEIPKKKRINF
jgi:DNA-3-methyladenine glycosylase II